MGINEDVIALDAVIVPSLEAVRDELRLFVAGDPNALTLPEIYSAMMTALSDFSTNEVGSLDPYKVVGQVHSRALEFVFDQLSEAQQVIAAQATQIAALDARITALETP